MTDPMAQISMKLVRPAHRNGGRYVARWREIRSLSWDACNPRHLDGAAVPPRICLAGSAQTRRVASVEAILPEFWAVCAGPDGLAGTGWVFPVPGRNGRQMAAKAISRVIWWRAFGDNPCRESYRR